MENLNPAPLRERDVLRNGTDSVRVGHRSATVLLNEKSHGSSRYREAMSVLVVYWYLGGA